MGIFVEDYRSFLEIHPYGDIVDSHTEMYVHTPEQAKELAQELQHAVNKLLHWVDKREEEE